MKAPLAQPTSTLTALHPPLPVPSDGVLVTVQPGHIALKPHTRPVTVEVDRILPFIHKIL